MKLSTRRSFHRYSAGSEGSEEGEIDLSEGVCGSSRRLSPRSRGCRFLGCDEKFPTEGARIVLNDEIR